MHEHLHLHALLILDNPIQAQKPTQPGYLNEASSQDLAPWSRKYSNICLSKYNSINVLLKEVPYVLYQQKHVIDGRL